MIVSIIGEIIGFLLLLCLIIIIFWLCCCTSTSCFALNSTSYSRQNIPCVSSKSTNSQIIETRPTSLILLNNDGNEISFKLDKSSHFDLAKTNQREHENVRVCDRRSTIRSSTRPDSYYLSTPKNNPSSATTNSYSNFRQYQTNE